MKANFRICPQCSTRNRLDKEFCVKCGEPPGGVKPGDPNEVVKKGKPGFFVTSEGKDASPIVQLQPTDLLPKQSLAQALEATRDLDGAARQYREILVAWPDASVTRALLSEVLMKQNRSDDAIRLLDEGLSVDANAAILYREKGRVFDRLERNAEEIAAYREYVRRSPGANDLRTFTKRIEQLQAAMEQ